MSVTNQLQAHARFQIGEPPERCHSIVMDGDVLRWEHAIHICIDRRTMRPRLARARKRNRTAVAHRRCLHYASLRIHLGWQAHCSRRRASSYFWNVRPLRRGEAARSQLGCPARGASGHKQRAKEHEGSPRNSHAPFGRLCQPECLRRAVTTVEIGAHVASLQTATHTWAKRSAVLPWIGTHLLAPAVYARLSGAHKRLNPARNPPISLYAVTPHRAPP